MEKENNKVKSKLWLVKLIFIIVCFCLFFPTSLILFFMGLLYGGVGMGISVVVSNAINNLGADPVGAIIYFIFKILLIYIIYKIFIHIIKNFQKRKEMRRKISEVGAVKYYATDIIESNGSDMFLNKTPEEIENFVNEYIDHFEVKLKGFSATDISNEIIEQLNE